MSKKIDKYTDEPIGEIRVIDDFLPSPKNLVLEQKKKKVTIVLTESSIEFFKQQAEEYHTSYQAMIRALLDGYAHKYGAEDSRHC